MAETLVPREPSGRMSGLAPRPFDAYFGPAAGRDPLAGERAFRRDMYALSKAVLAEKKERGVRIGEAAFVPVHAAMQKNCGALLAKLSGETEWAGRVALAAGLCATLLQEFLNHGPLRFDEAVPGTEGAGRRRACAVSCLAPVALACGLASVDREAASEPDLLEIAMLATDARMDRILPACGKPEAQDDLTSIFAALLAHLP